MSSKNDKFYLKLALNLAKQHKGLTRENPSVGCVIVKDNKILSLSKTSISGRPHAEDNAIRLANTNDLKGSTIYVTLEPCTHHGNTPPCTSISTLPVELKQSIFCMEFSKISISEGSVICILSIDDVHEALSVNV